MTRPRDRGSASVTMIVLVVVVLAGAGLIVDGGRAMVARRHAANTAEAAARFAVASQSLATEIDPEAARQAAVAYATRAGVPATDVTVAVEVDANGGTTVSVTVTERRSAVFLVLGGIDEMTVRATGAARFTYTA